MSKSYNPLDWYWQASDGRLYGSAAQSVVAANDGGYRAWAADGMQPTPWPRDAAGAESTAALQEVLAPYGLFVGLAEYAASVRYAHETGGITAHGAPIRTDRESQSLIMGAYLRATRDATATLKFKSEVGFVPLSAADIIDIGDAVYDHVQACFSAEADVLDKIEAGKITTRAQIDAAFAS